MSPENPYLRAARQTSLKAKLKGEALTSKGKREQIARDREKDKDQGGGKTKP